MYDGDHQPKPEQMKCGKHFVRSNIAYSIHDGIADTQRERERERGRDRETEYQNVIDCEMRAGSDGIADTQREREREREYQNVIDC